MRKSFYAGGFLYFPKKKHVFLHERDNNTPINPNMWAFFGGMREGKESPPETFQRELFEEIGYKINLKAAIPLCNYFNSDIPTHRYVFYVLVSSKPNGLELQEGKSFGWFPLANAFTLRLSKRTRQDLLTFQEKIGLSTI